MNKILVLSLGGLLVAGLSACASKGNFTSNGNDQQFAKNRAECRLITTQNFPSNSVISYGWLEQFTNIKQQNEATDFFNDCMTAKGYSQSPVYKPQTAQLSTPAIIKVQPTVTARSPGSPTSRFICVPAGSGSGYKAKLVEDGSVWMVTKIIGSDQEYCEDNRFILKAESIAYVPK